VAAPVLLLIFRLLQGFALGGEVGPSTAYLVEVAPPRRRGLYVSVQFATQDLAVLAAGMVGFTLARLLTPEALDDWGWRVAFLLGVAIVPLGLWMRSSLPETLHAARRADPAGEHPKVPARLLVLGLFLLLSTTISGYTLDFMTTYAQDSLKMSASLAFGATMVVGFAQSTSDVAAGMLSDRFGRRPVMLCGFALLLPLVVPAFMLMNQGHGVATVYGAMAVLSVLSAMAAGPIMVTIAESLPAAVRSGTLALLYAVTISCFGGSTQFAVQWLTTTTGSPLAPAWYMTGALVLGAVAALLIGESAPRRNWGAGP